MPDTTAPPARCRSTSATRSSSTKTIGLATGDVRTDQLAGLPQNPLGIRIADKVSLIIPITTASDQGALLVVMLRSPGTFGP